MMHSSATHPIAELTTRRAAQQSTPFVEFTHQEWSRFRADTPLTLSEADLRQLRGINERISLDEVVQIYLPLSRLLNLYVKATQDLYRATSTFLGHSEAKVPFVIGIAGSVAVGKSTTARVLQALLSRWPSHPKVDLVTTDGFLWPNRKLQELDLMERKGFPESYDRRSLMRFVSSVKAGQRRVSSPVYSHLTYDIVPGKTVVVDRPDIMILEGLNVLQSGAQHLFVSDFFDFSIYVDTEPKTVERWYVERFLALRDLAFKNPSSYFRRYADLSDDEATARARSIWKSINEVNLLENILPTRPRADLILQKGPDHSIRRVRLRKI